VQPLLGFIGGGVNNDAGLFAASAAVFWLVARALRRGLDRSTAIGIGAAFGLGLITKATIVGLAPGLVLCGALLVLRAGPERRRTVLRRIALAAGVAALPVVAYVLVNSLAWDRGLWGGAGAAAAGGGTGAGHPAQLREFVSYLWQFYLPRLPFMTDLQAGIPLYNVWFEGFIGRFGWLDTSWPRAVYEGAAVLFAAILALAAAGVWRVRESVRGRLGTVVVLGGMAAGFLLFVAWAGYRGRLDSGQIFEQARYLLPLGALYAALVALAARGAGRFGRPVGAVLVTLACGHAAFAVGLVVSRFYA
jgi:4-amino-4-deoxy-L-arabinose transferase-like glycosyltransferase